MPTFIVSPEALARDLEATGRGLLAEVVEVVRTTVKLHAPAIAQSLIDGEDPKPVDRGTYRRSFRAQDVRNGVVFYNSAAHGPIIEDGRRPGARMPPVDVLLDWVRRKGLGRELVGPVKASAGPRQRGAKRGPSDRSRAIAAAQYGIALSIARKIKARGLPAHHILARVEARLTPIVHEKIDNAVEGRK